MTTMIYQDEAITASAQDTRKVVFAAALGTVFEWYDFFVYGSLAVIFGAMFFPKGNETAALLAALATFGAGFVLRPFGAIFFGRLGDMIGRKYTFLVTMLVMGLATAAVGFLPTFETIGWFAPAILVGLRLLQGLAVGGEYGGAVTYVAEHSAIGRRGLTTSWMQITATLGLFLSLIVILICRQSMSAEAFASWGWRVPFVLSILLLVLSLYIRLKLEESPIFKRMKQEGRTSKNPIKDTLGNATSLKIVMLAIFGAVAGQGVIWYTGHFYSLYFMTSTLKIDYQSAYTYLTIALLLGSPLFVFFGWLSDLVGRKWIMMAGMLASVLLFVPIFQGLTYYGNPALHEFRANNTVMIDGGDCREDQTFIGQLFQPKATKDCTRAKAFLSSYAVPYETRAGGKTLEIVIGGETLQGYDEGRVRAALEKIGLPKAADPARINGPMMVLLLFTLVLLATMVYGPIGAFLVEMFPTKIRYSGVSVAMQIGNGWIGGFAPFFATMLVVSSGNIFAGLYYTVAVAALTLIIGVLFIRDTRHRDISE